MVKSASLKWRLSYIVAYPFFKFVVGVRSAGRENVPLRGPVIIASNHRSGWDPPVLGFASPREVHFIAKRELFNPILGPLIRLYNAHPIIRSVGAKSSLMTALKLLKEDLAIIVFPEGTRNRTKNPLLPLRRGIEWLAYNEEINERLMVVPTWIEHGKGFGRFTVRFGEPLKPCEIPRKNFLEVLRKKILNLREEKKEVKYGP